MLAAVYMALCLAPSPAPEPEPSDPPRAAFVGGAGGTQALGFKPFPANPTASIFGDVRWIERRYYGLHTTLALGYAGQVGFLHAGFMDAVLSQRVRSISASYMFRGHRRRPAIRPVIVDVSNSQA